jgi:hypothetical protein
MNVPIQSLPCVDGVSRKEQLATRRHQDSMDHLDLIKQDQAVMVQEQSSDRPMERQTVVQTMVAMETATAHLDKRLVRAWLPIDGMALLLAMATLLQVHLSKAFHLLLDLYQACNKVLHLLPISINITEHHLLLLVLQLPPTMIVSSKRKKCSNFWHHSSQAMLQSHPPYLLRHLPLLHLLLPLQLQPFLLYLPTLRHSFKWLRTMLPKSKCQTSGADDKESKLNTLFLHHMDCDCVVDWLLKKRKNACLVRIKIDLTGRNG